MQDSTMTHLTHNNGLEFHGYFAESVRFHSDENLKWRMEENRNYARYCFSITFVKILFSTL